MGKSVYPQARSPRVEDVDDRGEGAAKSLGGAIERRLRGIVSGLGGDYDEGSVVLRPAVGVVIACE